MTDNEIKKAFECCNQDSSKGCFRCPYRQYSPACLEKRNADTIDLINRLQAENEKLQGDNLMLSQKRITLPEAIKLVDNARNTAIKEFVKLLIYEIVNRPPEKTPNGVFYMNGRVDRQNEIIDIINELAGVYVETQEKTETSE